MTSSSQHAEAPRSTGSCLCRAVRYEVTGPLRNVVLCHCEMCRKTHGHIGAYAAAPREALTLTQSRGLEWYRSSPGVRRGFCGECGGTLFWERDDADMVFIAAGTLDAPTGLTTAWQIYVDSAGDYYQVDRSVPVPPE